jgi:hypothetical protein
MNQLIIIELMMLRSTYPCQLHVLELLLGEGLLLGHVEEDALARPVLLLHHHAALYTERYSAYQGLKGLYHEMVILNGFSFFGMTYSHSVVVQYLTKNCWFNSMKRKQIL